MRLGEKKYIVKKILNEQKQIALTTRSEAGGLVIHLDNWDALSQAFDMLLEEKWIIYDADKSDKLKAFIEKNAESDKLKFSDQAEDASKMEFYHLIKAFIDYINPTMPLWYDIFDSMEEEQDEQVINIKLNKDAITLHELTEINQRWVENLKILGLDEGHAEYPTISFDKGSNWYSVHVKNALPYIMIMGCLQVYQEVQITRQEYYKAEYYKIHYEMAKAKAENKKLTEDQYKEQFNETLIDSKIDEISKPLFTENTKLGTSSETQGRFKKFYYFVEKEMDKYRVIIEPSFNPPEYISGEKGIVKIDFDKIRKRPQNSHKPIEETKSKQITSEPDSEENK